ncbi:MAG: SUMF1/EgtB/PvdO family nonheme iron enzyme [Chloroflexota bacterium]
MRTFTWVPRVRRTGEREQLIHDAFYGSALIDLINVYNRNAREFAVYLIDECVKFGDVSEGRHSLIALLDEIYDNVGVNFQNEIVTIKGILDAQRLEPESDGEKEKAESSEPSLIQPWMDAGFKSDHWNDSGQDSKKADTILEPDVKPAQPDKLGGTQFIASEVEPTAPTTMTAADLTRLTLEILPPPFAWIDIPGGWVTLEDHPNKFKVEPFMMAKYPVTNAQFGAFMQAGGYNDQRWWGDGLWDVRQEKGWTEPGYWGDSKWNGADYPVVGVSWYEAIAFTRWLSHTVGTRNGASGTITLPTEMQWQRAAQGDDGREYPYGNTFDASRANTEESGIGKTTPVTQYEGKGDSPYGVVDMSGNVWHWCLNTYGQPEDIAIDDSGARRVLRGGAWFGDHDGARSAYRGLNSPINRNVDNGFLVLRVRPPSL